MARTARQVATADPAATMTAEEEAQMAAMAADDQNEPEAPEAPQEAAGAQETPEATEGGAEPEAAPQRSQTVPHAAFHEERERRKAAEARIAELAKAQQTLEERTNLLLQRFAAPAAPVQQPQPSGPAIPDLAADPVGHIVGLMQAQGLELAQLRQWAAGQEQQRAQVSNIGTIQQRAIAAEHVFARDNPDYPAAVAHLAAVRHQELEAAGYEDAAERQAIISREALTLAERALSQGRNPADMVYGLAKIRGYAPATSPATNGAAAPEVPLAAATATPQQRIQQIAAGQQQARGLGAVRGAGPAPLTAQRLLEMNDADFAKMIQTPAGRDLLGA